MFLRLSVISAQLDEVPWHGTIHLEEGLTGTFANDTRMQ